MKNKLIYKIVTKTLKLGLILWAGTARLIQADKEAIVARISTLLRKYAEAYLRTHNRQNLEGECLQELKTMLGLTSKKQEKPRLQFSKHHKNWNCNAVRIRKTRQKKIWKMLPCLMSRLVVSEFDINKRKVEMHPNLYKIFKLVPVVLFCSKVHQIQISKVNHDRS